MKRYKVTAMVKRLLVVIAICCGMSGLFAQTTDGTAKPAVIPMTPGAMSDALSQREKSGLMQSMTNRQREAAVAEQAAAAAQQTPKAKSAPLMTSSGPLKAPLAAMNPGGTPDYFNVANWAFTPIIPKFVDDLPGLGAANASSTTGAYIPIAVKIPLAGFPNDDYYEIGLVDYDQQMSSGFPNTTRLRGYKDLAPGADGAAHYLGPLIIANKDKPVRIKYTNMLPISTNPLSKYFIPVDTSVMGAGAGPQGGMYTENRTELHLHGGVTPWISDGTPHQWFTPAADPTPYKQGASFQSVPDMPLPAVGAGWNTYYYTNQQSARLMFYHDHSLGTTRIGVYAGQAAGYLLTDTFEENLITTGALPDLGGVYHYGIPLIIQDKTFVDAATLPTTDPTWNWGITPGTPHTGDLWFPHVYMPNQNPALLTGANPFGRWDYGPWFWPPVPASSLPPGNGPVLIAPGVYAPGTPNPSLTPEAFMDTPLVNGCPYPKLTVEPKPYRFRILNACNDRFLNLQLYYVDPLFPTEVKMVPAVPTVGWPATWPTDGRAGGVPDPTTAGPSMIQVGTEGGFLPAPVVLPPQPINYTYDRRNIVVLNVQDKALFIGPAERADIVVDFSAVPPGSKLILYNDAPAPVPAFDTRLDYYTGDPDQTSTGGAPSTAIGFGPNTRTIMLFNVAGPVGGAFNLATLQAAMGTTYVASQPEPIVPETAYPLSYAAATDTYSRIQDNSLTYTPVGAAAPVTTAMQPKAIQELFELNYGRMNATLGTELPFTNFNTQTTVPLGYIDPPTETFNNGEAQIWKITHNGVDTHAIHFHLFNVQVINRVGWDGAIRPPDPNELGWKETVRMNPLEDCIVAMKAVLPTLPFTVPDSVRLLNPAMPEFSTMWFSTVGPDGLPISVSNISTNFGNEYVWHCHILGHEENDMMRPMVVSSTVQPANLPAAPTNLLASITSATQVTLDWTDNATNETGYLVQRAVGAGAFATLATTPANSSTYIDTTALAGTTYSYQVLAFNVLGNSAPSNTATITFAKPAAPSALVAVPSVLSTAAPTMTLTWVDNSNNASGFVLQRATNSGFTAGSTIFSTSNVTYTDITVGRGVTYFYRVLASNGIGSSAYSNTATATAAGQLSNAPVIGVATAGNTQATVTFTAPAPNGSTAIMTYTATSSPGGKTATSATSPITVKGLTNGTPYTFTVTALNASGTSAASAASNSVTPATAPGAPTGVFAARAGSGIINVAYVAPVSNGGSAITSYTVTSTPGGIAVSGLANPLVVAGLTNGTSYTFKVTATNIMGTGPASAASAALTAATTPGTPTNVAATAGVGQATVTFTAVPTASNGGTPITSYTATAYVNGVATLITQTGTASPLIVTGLTAGAPGYSFKVTATNAVGTGAASAASAVVIPTAFAPGAPTAVVGSRVLGLAYGAAGQISVVFTAPSMNGSALVNNGYTVTSTPGGLTGIGNASPIVVSGLTNGTSYTFKVTARNGIGRG